MLAGREELLAELDTMLTRGGDAGPRIVALCGLGGAGKTSVAVKYAHRHLGEVGVAWQFAAEDATVLATDFTELAAQLRAQDLGANQDPVASVHAVLAASPYEWLLVFDNALDQAAVARYLPQDGPGRVLITSRNTDWPPGQGLDVPVLDLEAAGELGGLPLALEQAGAYVRSSGISLAGYLALFRRRRPEMLARGTPTGYGSTVAATWSLAFTELEQAAPKAVGLLRLLAFCAPEAVPLRLLLQPCPGLAEQLSPQVALVLALLLDDELAAGDAVAALRRYSLARPAPGGAVSVHRLVQAVTADQMPEELAGAWRQAAAALIEAAIPDDPERPDTWPTYAALPPHAQAALGAGSTGMARIAIYLGSTGSYLTACELLRGIVEERARMLARSTPIL
jgi:hypothetical protein